VWGWSDPGKGLASAKVVPAHATVPSQVAASMCSSQQGASWGGQQALLPLLWTAWGEQQSPARAGEAVSSQQLHNLLLGETFQRRDPTCGSCLPCSVIVPAKRVQSPMHPCLPHARDNVLPHRARRSRLVLEGDAHRAAPWEPG